MSIKEIGMHGVDLNGKGVVHVESDTLARKIRTAIREYVVLKPNAGFKELQEIASFTYSHSLKG
jgi:hypothetical protein